LVGYLRTLAALRLFTVDERIISKCEAESKMSIDRGKSGIERKSTTVPLGPPQF
jgi:hypothetical protein